MHVNSFSAHDVRTTQWSKFFSEVHWTSLSKRNWCRPKSREFFDELLVAETAGSILLAPIVVLVAVIVHVPFE